MKRRVLLSVICAFVLLLANAQTLLNEGFEGNTFPPEGWSVIDDTQPGSEGRHWALVNKTPIAGNQSVNVTCGNRAEEPIKEEWLITPALKLTNDSYKLEFKWVAASAQSIAKENPEYDFQIKVSTDNGGTWTKIWSFLNEDQVKESGINFPWTGWAKNASLVDLTAFKGQTIKIAFVHCKLIAGSGGNDVKLDDILVEKYAAQLTPQLECSTPTYTFPESYIGSKKYSDVLTLKNIGTGTLKVTSITGLEGTNFSTSIVPSDVSLKKNEEYQFQLIYQPTLTGSPTAIVQINANEGTPISIQINGDKIVLPNGYTYESFENEGFPPVGWKIQTKSGSFSGWTAYKGGGFSGDRVAMCSATQESSLISPRLNLSGDQDYTITFDYMEQYDAETDGFPNNYFELYLSTDGGVTWGKPIFTNAKNQSEEDLNKIFRKEVNLGHPGDNCYLKWTYSLDMDLSGGVDGIPPYSVVFMDDVILPPLYGVNDKPAATTLISPKDAATDIYNRDVVLSWNSTLFATGYKLYVGTSASNFNIVSGEDMGVKTSYTINRRLEYATQYFWKVVPYNTAGEAENVPTWSFTIMADQSVKDYPYFQGFEDNAIPLGWNTIKQDYTRWDISNYNAFEGQGSAYISGSTDNSTGILTTPEFVLPNEDIQISFYWGNGVPSALKKDILGMTVNNTTEPDGIDIIYFEIEENGSWETLAMLSDKTNKYWMRERLSLNNYKGKTVTFRWRFNILNGMKSTGASLDNIKIETIGEDCMAYFNANEWNAGEVNYEKSANSKNTLSLTNGGEAKLTVKDVKFSTTNFTANLAVDTEIEANKAATFAITFNAGTSAAKVEDQMVVTFTNNQSISLSVSGIGLPKDIIYYNFEDDEFASTSPNGFTTVDVDSRATIQPVMINYPKIGNPFAYIVINHKPAPEGADWRNIYPHSGDQVLAAIADATHSYATNDWIISDQMTATAESKFRFYAKSYGNEDQFKLHKVSVWVSTTTKDINSFEVVESDITLPHSNEQAFTEFSIGLGKYAGQKIYVGLQHIADPESFVAFFDDFYFEHFSYNGSGINSISENAIRIYPNPASDVLYVEGSENAKVMLTSVSGKVIRSEENINSMDVSALPAGVYLITVQTGDKVQTTRIIKK